jgi:prolipoprotein diacylglyceryltransferase
VPTQLLSAVWALAVCALGFSLMALAVPPGVPAALSTLVYALGRFAIESLRDEERWIGGRLTRGQLLSAALAGVALIIVLFLRPSGPALPFTLSLGEPLHHGPALFIVALMVFLVGGYHRRTVGQW